MVQIRQKNHQQNNSQVFQSYLQALQEATQSTNFGQFFLAERILVELVNLHPQLLESQKVSRKLHPGFQAFRFQETPFPLGGMDS